MASNYAKQQPNDKEGQKMQNYDPAFKAITRYERNNLTVSSIFTLSDDTTIVEVAAVGTSAAIRWVPVTETAAVTPFASVITLIGSENFDHVVAKDTVRQFVVPRESQGVPSIVGINKQAGLYNRIAVISAAAVSSVLLAEF